jgi:hypothetical protein
VLHAKARLGNPYPVWGQTLRDEDTEMLASRKIKRAYADTKYPHHDTAIPRRVFISAKSAGFAAPSGAQIGSLMADFPWTGSVRNVYRRCTHMIWDHRCSYTSRAAPLGTSTAALLPALPALAVLIAVFLLTS